MLKISKTDITDTLAWFKKRGFQVSFVVPTQTGLDKSIMDATSGFREFLKTTNIHNFDEQRQGISNKKIVKTKLYSKNQFHETKTSLYRPETKNGDPRLWIYGLTKHTLPGDLLGFLIVDNEFLVINCSNTDLHESNKNLDSIINKATTFSSSRYSSELLNKLQDIANQGYIKSMRRGDTGVGYTLETMLGIQANSSKNPDYKGIEIKSSRSRATRGTLLSMVPSWENSNISSAENLLHKRGKPNEKWGGLKTLNHTITGDRFNNWNLRLALEPEYIFQIYKNNNLIEKDVVWMISEFTRRLAGKHRETFWINVETRNFGGNEEFHYKSILHTGDLDAFVIPSLIERGIITLDYLLWEKGKDWQKYTSKRGFDFLWKIKNKDKDLLFKFVRNYDLS